MSPAVVRAEFPLPSTLGPSREATLRPGPQVVPAAITTPLSRVARPLPRRPGGSSSPDAATGPSGGGEDYVLVPFVDSMNHVTTAETDLSFDPISDAMRVSVNRFVVVVVIVVVPGPERSITSALAVTWGSRARAGPRTPQVRDGGTLARGLRGVTMSRGEVSR